MVPVWLSAIVVGLLVAIAVYLLGVIVRHRFTQSEPREPSDDERERRYAEVRRSVAEIRAVRPGAVETALFLVNEAKATFERAHAASAELEAKATTLLGIVAGASSALGVFGTLRDGKAIIAAPVIIAALACAVIAIFCLLFVLRAKRCDAPDLGPYVSAAMVSDDNRIGLGLVLAQRYRQMAQQLLRGVRNEPRALFGARAATACAATLVLVNAATSNRIVVNPPGRARLRIRYCRRRAEGLRSVAETIALGRAHPYPDEGND